MYIKLKNATFDEKDVLLVILTAFIIAANYLSISLEPFRNDSLLAVLIMLAITRIISTYLSSYAFFFAVILAIICSTFLSPYSLVLFLGLYLMMLKLAKKV